MKRKKRKKYGLSVLLYLLAAAAAVIVQISGVMRPVENSAEDALYQTGAAVSPSISVIGIDEETLSEYGSFDIWGRQKTADLINLLMADPKEAPAVIAVDVGFFGEKDPEADAALTEAVRKAGNVVLVSTATFGNVVEENEDGSYTAHREPVLLEQPYDDLKEAALAVGHSNVQADDDGVARHAIGSITFQGNTVSSFPYQIYQAYTGKADSSFGNNPSQFYIRYAGKPHSYYGAVGAGSSFHKVLDGEYPVRAFAGGVVLIGAYASGMQDHYFTSIDRGEPMYGVEIHANILQQLLDGVEIHEISTIQMVLITLGLSAVVILLVVFLDNRAAVPLSILLGAGYVFSLRPLYEHTHLILPVIAPALAVFVIIILHVVISYVEEYRRRKRIVNEYGKYLSPEVAGQIAAEGTDVLSLGGQKKDIAVLFVDIRSFTTLSEQLSPEEVVRMLNTYLSVTTKAIFDQKGTVDKFIGDATMGVFNAPLDLDDYTYRAVCAGLEMVEGAKKMRNQLAPELRDKVGFGVGINCGEAVVGNIGTDFRMEYTAIGDTVNTASRLEGKAPAGTVVISDAVYQRVRDRIICEDMGEVSLKGKAAPVKIWRAVSIREKSLEGESE